MKRQPKIKIGLSRISPTDLVEQGRIYASNCAADPAFEFPADLLPGIASACDELEKANMQMLHNGGRVDRIEQAARMEELRELIRRLASYVEAQAMGDMERIINTGFKLHRKPQPVGVLEAPQNLRAQRGLDLGEVRINWRGARGRRWYSLEFNANDPNLAADWQVLVNTTKNYYTATGLETDKKYYFRVRAVSSAGPGEVSQMASGKAA